MSPRIILQRRVREPRYLRLGPFRLWAVRIPQGPNIGFGRIATTDTPSNPAPEQEYVRDGYGLVLVLGGVAFAALRCRSVPVQSRRP
ncbi:hypothetical protein IM697_18440 [Streptomyces ferrugineus]|uniref:Uncharacterized protein n=1 Tax=Streptomyces ferrugineus TaxID=1413221 RepID=A0A7M2SY44_9ACTN|nr:hypothetical protein [Streptomyces ferrugineus]QOV40201.1 hypothetical protein IM697_18440 [Streptomyces ferrugineus]